MAGKGSKVRTGVTRNTTTRTRKNKPLSASYQEYKAWIAAGRPGGKFPGKKGK